MGVLDIFSRFRHGGDYKDSTGAQSSGPDTFGNASGVILSDEKSMQVSTVWACVRLLSELVGTIPIHVYEGEGDERRVSKDHPLYRVLHRKPNRYQTAVEFKETMMMHLAMKGNAYAFIDRERPGDLDSQVVSLVPMFPESMNVILRENGSVAYEYTTEKAVRVFREEDILHIRLMGPGPVIGLSPFDHMRNSLGVAVSVEEHTSKFFANSARPSGVLTVEQFMKPEDRKALQERWNQAYCGNDNAFKVFLMEGGMNYNPVTISPKDAEMLELAAFNVEEICRFFRVPPQLIGQTDKASSWASSLENLNMYFLQYSMRPYLLRWEQAINEKLLPAGDRGKYYAEFKAEAILRTDAETRANVYSSAINNGWMTPNEVRKKENLPAVDGADELARPVNLMPVSESGEDGK